MRAGKTPCGKLLEQSLDEIALRGDAPARNKGLKWGGFMNLAKVGVPGSNPVSRSSNLLAKFVAYAGNSRARVEPPESLGIAPITS